MPLQSKLVQATSGAITLFTKLYDHASVSGGPKTTATGYSAMIICSKTGYRLLVATMHSQPGEFAIGVASDADDDVEYDVLPEDKLTAATFVKYMEPHFAK